MTPKKIKIEGMIEMDAPEFLCVCQYCGEHNRERASIEFNFREQAIFHLCQNCKKMNVIRFGKEKPPPLPKTRLSH